MNKITKRKSYNPKGRSQITYQNKLHKLTKKYNQTFKNSQKAKIQYDLLPIDKQKREKSFFCDKYKTLNSFLEIQKIKEVNIK